MNYYNKLNDLINTTKHTENINGQNTFKSHIDEFFNKLSYVVDEINSKKEQNPNNKTRKINYKTSINNAFSENNPLYFNNNLDNENLNDVFLKKGVLEMKNLVVEGGGNKGVAYIGVLDALKKLGLLDSFDNFGGSSAGAITASFLFLDIDIDDISEFIQTTNFSEIQENKLETTYEQMKQLPNMYKIIRGTKEALQSEKTTYNFFEKQNTFILYKCKYIR